AEGLPGGQQDLGVAAGAEDVAAALELGLEVAEVVDLAVVDDPGRAVGRAHRLPPGHQVDDSQAGHAQAHARLDVHALVVRSPVLEGPHHRRQQLGWRSPDVPGDPAHGSRPALRRLRDPGLAGARRARWVSGPGCGSGVRRGRSERWASRLSSGEDDDGAGSAPLGAEREKALEIEGLPSRWAPHGLSMREKHWATWDHIRTNQAYGPPVSL